MRELNLNHVIGNVTKMLRPLIGEHVSLEILPGRELGTIQADPGQIEQILVNLCLNARDAMPLGGSIAIETENILFDPAYCRTHAWAEPGRYALLSVSDTGHGMDADTLERIFEPFFTTKEVGEGTGLGLATVYGLVKQHGGLIHVYSEIGQGTIFKLYFPLVERVASAVGHEIDGPIRGGRETILLAEDDEFVRNLNETILQRAGYSVLTASDGEEAVELFNAHSTEIDLALLDVMMPKLGGRGVYERIRENCPKMRVLFASGYSMNAIHTDFVLHEGLHLIQKPCGRERLLHKIRQVLDAAEPE